MIDAVEPLQMAIDYRPSLQTLHLGLFGAMTVIALVVAHWIYRTRRTRGAHLFAATLLLLSLRTGSDVIHGLVGQLWTVQAVLVAVNPVIELSVLVVFVRFAGRYSRLSRVRSDRATWVMVGLVVAAATIIATNPIHELAFTAFHRIEMPFTYIGPQRGPLGLALVAVNGVLLLVGAGLLAHAFSTGVNVAWWPSIVLSMAVSQAILIGGLQFLNGGVLPQYDYYAIAIGGFVLLTTLALLDHGLRPIEGVARAEILDEIDDAVVFLDVDGDIVDYNTAAAKLFRDIDTAEPLTERFDERERFSLDGETARTEITLDGPEMDTERLWNAFGPREETDGSRGELGHRDFLVHGARVRSETTELLGYTVRFVDVTELKRRSRELERKNDQLDQFASVVSHDLRNPLTVADGYLEMVSQSTDSSDSTDELDIEQALSYLDKVEVSLDRMAVIIDDILALMANAEPVTDTQPVDFEGVATAAWESVATGNATVHIDAGGHIEADPDRLQRLLENLFRNAIDHVGEDVTIETGLDETTFYVADDGPGIPEVDRGRIFEHGYTTGDEGTGLGLSIVEQLAEAHGWEVVLDPDHDGARFVVSGCKTTLGSETVSSDV